MDNVEVFKGNMPENVWHFCHNCSKWPEAGVSAYPGTLPPGARICSECIALEQGGECQRPSSSAAADSDA